MRSLARNLLLENLTESLLVVDQVLKWILPLLFLISLTRSGDHLSNVNEEEQAEKSERWFKRVAELHNVPDLASAVSDDDFPEIMPIRKGENRFVVSKKKDRSLTSPMYKKRMSMEQANNTIMYPFSHFHLTSSLTDGADAPSNPTNDTSSSMVEKPPQKGDDTAFTVANKTHAQRAEDQLCNANARSFEENFSEMRETSASIGVTSRGNSSQNFIDPDSTGRRKWSGGDSMNENESGATKVQASVQNFSNVQTSLTGTASQSSSNRDARDSWNRESLEGSSVKEPDTMDMSEEAKTERWFLLRSRTSQS